MNREDLKFLRDKMETVTITSSGLSPLRHKFSEKEKDKLKNTKHQHFWNAFDFLVHINVGMKHFYDEVNKSANSSDENSAYLHHKLNTDDDDGECIFRRKDLLKLNSERPKYKAEFRDTEGRLLYEMGSNLAIFLSCYNPLQPESPNFRVRRKDGHAIGDYTKRSELELYEASHRCKNRSCCRGGHLCLDDTDTNKGKDDCRKGICKCKPVTCINIEDARIFWGSNRGSNRK